MVKIIYRDDRMMVFNGNAVLGYVENDKLFGLDRDGYAVEICHIDNNHQIEAKFREWQCGLSSIKAR